MRTAASALAIVTVLAGCGAQRPVVYLGERPTADAERRAAGDVDACLAIGEQYRTGTGHGANVARDAAVGGAAGGAAGAVGGAIGGSPSRGAVAGAATGAVWALMTGVFRRSPPDPGFRGAVDQCLADRGRRVIAWK